MAEAAPDRHHRILLAATRAQRRIRVIYLLLVLVFAAALGYLLVRVALAVLAQRPPVTLDSEPHEVAPDPLPPAEWLPIGEAENGHGHGAPARQWRVSADDAAALEAQGFAVLRADEVRREGHEQALRAWQRAAAGAPADEEALATFRARLTEAEQALEQAYDYGTAVRRYEAALAVRVPYFEREVAVLGLDKAQVFHTVTRGVEPLQQTHRVVRYTPPDAEPPAAIVGLVPRSLADWRGPGAVRLTRLDSNTATALRITSRWGVEELAGEALDEARATRILSQVRRINRLRARHVLAPHDLLAAAVVARETGDIRTPDGAEASAGALAHAWLSQAYDMCAAARCSLTQTVLLRRDPLFAVFVRLQPSMVALEQRLAAAGSAAERAPLAGRLDEERRRAQEVLDTLASRYPRAWDFRGLDGVADAAERLSRLLQRTMAEAQREADAESAAAAEPQTGETTAQPEDDRTPQPPVEASTAERIRFFVEQGDQAMKLGNELSWRAREVASSAGATRLLDEACAQYMAARNAYREARALAPNDPDVAEKLRLANRDIYWIRREMALHR